MSFEQRRRFACQSQHFQLLCAARGHNFIIKVVTCDGSRVDQCRNGKRKRPSESGVVTEVNRITRRIVIGLLLAAFFFALRLSAAAHDIPNDVTVQAFLKPEAERLQFLVRVPLRACRDVDFPTRGPGYLDIARSDTSLPIPYRAAP